MVAKTTSLSILACILSINYALAQPKPDSDGKFVKTTLTRHLLADFKEDPHPFYTPSGFKMFLTLNYSDVSGPTIEPREVLIRVEELRNSDLLERDIYHSNIKVSAAEKLMLEYTLYQFVGGKKTSEEFTKGSSAAWKDLGYEDVAKLGQPDQEQMSRYALYGFFFGEKPFSDYAKDEAKLWKEKGYVNIADKLSSRTQISTVDLIGDIGRVNELIGRSFARPNSMRPNSSFYRTKVRVNEMLMQRSVPGQIFNVFWGLRADELEQLLGRSLTPNERKIFDELKTQPEKTPILGSTKKSFGGTDKNAAPKPPSAEDKAQTTQPKVLIEDKK